MIRSQQAQLQQLQQQQQHSTTGTAIVDETTPQSASTPFPPIPPLPPAGGRVSTQLSPSFSSRRQSRTSSQAGSPSLRPQSSLHHLRGPPEGLESLAGTSDNTASRSNNRDDCAFYQAEAAMLSRENQMLRQRIRDLGKSCMRHFTFSRALSLFVLFPSDRDLPFLTPDLSLLPRIALTLTSVQFLLPSRATTFFPNTARLRGR